MRMAMRMSHDLRDDEMRMPCASRVTQAMRIARRHAASRDTIGAVRIA
jgi:hypothetical protein